MWLPCVAKAADSKPGAYSRQGGSQHVGESHPRTGTGRLDGALSAFSAACAGPYMRGSPHPAIQ